MLVPRWKRARAIHKVPWTVRFVICIIWAAAGCRLKASAEKDLNWNPRCSSWSWTVNVTVGWKNKKYDFFLIFVRYPIRRRVDYAINSFAATRFWNIRLKIWIWRSRKAPTSFKSACQKVQVGSLITASVGWEVSSDYKLVVVWNYNRNQQYRQKVKKILH